MVLMSMEMVYGRKLMSMNRLNEVMSMEIVYVGKLMSMEMQYGLMSRRMLNELMSMEMLYGLMILEQAGRINMVSSAYQTIRVSIRLRRHSKCLEVRHQSYDIWCD